MSLFQLLFGEWIQLLFHFNGRVNRANYWLSLLIYLAALLFLYILGVVVGALIGIPDVATLLFVVAFVGVVISATAVAVKRLHDRNKSGWWLLLFYGVPSMLGGIGRYAGYEPVFQLAGTLLSIWALVELGILRGTRGRNNYGSDPLAVGNMRTRR